MWSNLHLRLILLDTVWGKIGGRRTELNRQENTKRQVKIRTLTGKGWGMKREVQEMFGGYKIQY